jgi:hypothetical protein
MNATQKWVLQCKYNFEAKKNFNIFLVKFIPVALNNFIFSKRIMCAI